jgi:hypothetical protein
MKPSTRIVIFIVTMLLAAISPAQDKEQKSPEQKPVQDKEQNLRSKSRRDRFGSDWNRGRFSPATW